MRKKYLYLIGACFALLSCQDDEVYLPITKIDALLENALLSSSEGIGKSYYVLPDSDNFSAIPQDLNNQLTLQKVQLGKLLFHETGLATKASHVNGMGTYSCASCHHSRAGFQSGKRQGIGDGGIGFGVLGESRTMDSNYTNEMVDIQPIKSPTILNGAYQKLMLWNGQFGATDGNIGTESQWTSGTPKETNHLGFEGVETQAIAGLTVHRLDVNDDLIISLGYKELFDASFQDIPPSERYTLKNAGLAIAAYERTVLANKAPFQNWLKGDSNAISDDEKQGAIVFFGKGKCFTCHNGPSLNSMEFRALGMNDLTGNDVLNAEVEENTKKGRGGFTQNPEDNYKFKVPQLYSIRYNSFYGHGSSFNSIKSIIEYKNNGIKENLDVPHEALDANFVPLGLTEQDIDYLTLFIEKSLDDPFLDRYAPLDITSGNCFPNNDPISQSDLGCK